MSDKIGKVLVALEVLDRSLRAGPSHPLLGLGSLYASLIAVGWAYVRVVERCFLVLPETAADHSA